MHLRARRAFAALTVAAAAAAVTITAGPADAAPRWIGSPVSGSLTTPLLPEPVPLPEAAVLNAEVDDEARTVAGDLDIPTVEFDVDLSDLGIDLEGLPDEVTISLEMSTPDGVDGSWTADGVATMTGTLRLDIGDTTIGGVPIGALGGCYYDLDLDMTGTMEVATGSFRVADESIEVPEVTGLCQAVLAGLGEFLEGEQFGLSIKVPIGTAPTTSTSEDTSSTETTSSSSSSDTTETTSSSSSSTDTTSDTSSTTSTTIDATSSTTEHPSSTTTDASTTSTTASASASGANRTPTASAATTTRGNASYVG